MLGKILNIVLLGVFLTPNAFSQSDSTNDPKVSLYEPDTVLIFSIQQGKKLSFINETMKTCIAEKSILDNQLFEKDNIIRIQAEQLANFDSIVANYDTIVLESNNLLKICEDEKVVLHLDVKRLRRQKFFAMLIGGISTTFITYLYITK